MAGGGGVVVPDVSRVVLNLGCGKNKIIGAVNIDLYGSPDIRWNLEETPLPFADNSVDEIVAHHILEHIHNWWNLFVDCSRILKPGGVMKIDTPHESSTTALTYRDHVNVFSRVSFMGCLPGMTPHKSGTNSWASDAVGECAVPMRCIDYYLVPLDKYMWMLRWPFRRVLKFCADHMRNFIWQQCFVFEKVEVDKNER